MLVLPNRRTPVLLKKKVAPFSLSSPVEPHPLHFHHPSPVMLASTISSLAASALAYPTESAATAGLTNLTCSCSSITSWFSSLRSLLLSLSGNLVVHLPDLATQSVEQVSPPPTHHRLWSELGQRTSFFPPHGHICLRIEGRCWLVPPREWVLVVENLFFLLTDFQ